jgi:hypothetical protein
MARQKLGAFSVEMFRLKRIRNTTIPRGRNLFEGKRGAMFIIKECPRCGACAFVLVIRSIRKAETAAKNKPNCVLNTATFLCQSIVFFIAGRK